MIELQKMIDDMGWGLDAAAPEAIREPHDVIHRIQFLESHLALNEYEPALLDLPSFMERLSAWLQPVKSLNDRLIMLQLLLNIMYLGKLEYDSLYRAALGGQIVPWIIDEEEIDLLDPEIDRLLKQGLAKTCFSAATDSMRINAFHTVNNIGNGFRPEWRSLFKATSGCRGCNELKAGLLAHLEEKKMKRIVILEDFVGTFTQAEEVLEFVASFGLPTLFAPLVICSKGDDNARKFSTKWANVAYAPVLKLSDDLFINDDIYKLEPRNEVFEQIADLARRLHGVVTNHAPDMQIKPYGPFGKYDTGATFVKYTNCPDNTLPIIHFQSATWSALFPRSSRIEVGTKS